MSAAAPTVIIYTDGGCWGNPGIGAWAAVLRSGKHRKEVSGGEIATTNNRMELKAAIHALTALTKPCTVELHTDSQYVRNGITQWLAGWKKNGWRTKDKKPVKNADLWQSKATPACRTTSAATSWPTSKWRKSKASTPPPSSPRPCGSSRKRSSRLRKPCVE